MFTNPIELISPKSLMDESPYDSGDATATCDNGSIIMVPCWFFEIPTLDCNSGTISE